MELKRAWFHYEKVSGSRAAQSLDKSGRPKRGIELVGSRATKPIARWDPILAKHMGGKPDAIQPEARIAPVKPERHANQ
jgi:hypothetical protein